MMYSTTSNIHKDGMNTFLGFEWIDSDSATTNINIKSNNHDPFKQQQQQQLPAKHAHFVWFPWIPTRAQIDALSLQDLKEACIQRGIHNRTDRQRLTASEFRTALWEWTRNQQQQQTINPSSAIPLQNVPDSLQVWARQNEERLLKKGREIKNKKYSAPPQIGPDNVSNNISNNISNNNNNHDTDADGDGDDDNSQQHVKEIRRLSRLAIQSGDVSQARQLLEQGVQLFPNHAPLYVGLATIALKSNQDARTYLKESIRVDPTLTHAHYMLGTMEHYAGHVALAMDVLQQGLGYSPKCHKLHQALGDVYRCAMMQDMANAHYIQALETAPPDKQPYAQLAFTAYDNANVPWCRHWLKEGSQVNKGLLPMWARMEEAQGNVVEARGVIHMALAAHCPDDPSASHVDSCTLRLGADVKAIYTTWARLERRHGTPETIEQVHSKAIQLFPDHWELYHDWAVHHAKLGNLDQARALFHRAMEASHCQDAKPYRHLAQLWMNQGNYQEASTIFYRGAAVAKAGGKGTAELYIAWAVCEWHLGKIPRVQVLLDHALTMTTERELRSFIYYAMAQLEVYNEQYELAQHWIGLSLKENLMPGGNSKIWRLWLEVALATNREHLIQECTAQVERLRREEEMHGLYGRLLLVVPTKETLAQFGGTTMAELVTREPWVATRSTTLAFLDPVDFPTKRAGPVVGLEVRNTNKKSKAPRLGFEVRN
jgi:tetratricopeptide (TPR) repeat protein